MVRTVPVDLQFEQVVQKIAPQAKLLRVWPLAGGLAAQMIAFEIEKADGYVQRLIVRRPNEFTLQRNPDAVERLYKLLQMLQSLGLPTPTPVYYDPSGEIFAAPYLVIEYIQGHMNFSPVDLSAAMCQFADHLVKIHRVEITKYAHSFLLHRTNRCPEITTITTGKLNIIMEERRIRNSLASFTELSGENTAVLLHGDYWPGNVLWQDATLVAVIDWEDATLGDPLIDLAISRLDLVWIFGIDAMHTFTQRYQSQMDIDYKNMPYWDLCAALRLIRLAGSNLAEWVTFFPPFGRVDITEQSLLTNYLYFINHAFEKLARGNVTIRR